MLDGGEDEGDKENGHEDVVEGGEKFEEEGVIFDDEVVWSVFLAEFLGLVIGEAGGGVGVELGESFFGGLLII